MRPWHHPGIRYNGTESGRANIFNTITIYRNEFPSQCQADNKSMKNQACVLGTFGVVPGGARPYPTDRFRCILEAFLNYKSKKASGN